MNVVRLAFEINYCRCHRKVGDGVDLRDGDNVATLGFCACGSQWELTPHDGERGPYDACMWATDWYRERDVRPTGGAA